MAWKQQRNWYYGAAGINFGLALFLVLGAVFLDASIGWRVFGVAVALGMSWLGVVHLRAARGADK
jgi:hypothetical protein